jgi:hypothetical protein
LRIAALLYFWNFRNSASVSIKSSARFASAAPEVSMDKGVGGIRQSNSYPNLLLGRGSHAENDLGFVAGWLLCLWVEIPRTYLNDTCWARFIVGRFGGGAWPSKLRNTQLCPALRPRLAICSRSVRDRARSVRDRTLLYRFRMKTFRNASNLSKTA